VYTTRHVCLTKNRTNAITLLACVIPYPVFHAASIRCTLDLKTKQNPARSVMRQPTRTYATSPASRPINVSEKAKGKRSSELSVAVRRYTRHIGTLSANLIPDRASPVHLLPSNFFWGAAVSLLASPPRLESGAGHELRSLGRLPMSGSQLQTFSAVPRQALICNCVSRH